jgi:hypothetical protein
MTVDGSRLNVDFEHPKLKGRDGGPELTYAGGGGMKDADYGDYFGHVDSFNVHSGKYSLRMTYLKGVGGLAKQTTNARPLRGRNIVYTAWVKTENITGAKLWIRIDDDQRMLENEFSDPLSGTNDWTKLTQRIRVPEEATVLQYGLLLRGPGDAWLDDMNVELLD